MHFTKMQGIGNDYIYFNCMTETVPEPEALSIRLSDRHFGIGGDGIVLILPSERADFRMRMFNADGSEGKMCGNATRCIGKYVYEKGLTDRTELTLETLSGIKRLSLSVSGGTVQSVSVDMGKAEFAPEAIPVSGTAEEVIQQPLILNGREWKITCVSMGNPHCVTFCPSVSDLDLPVIGPAFEHHAMFPERVNTEFVRVLDRTHLQMRVWERGSGETFACGTGACAVAAAAVRCGICDPDTDITVHLLGGDLSIRVLEDRSVRMTGGAEFVFEGEIQ